MRRILEILKSFKINKGILSLSCFWILLFFFTQSRYVWSFDGATYALSFRDHTYSGVTGHPVYAYFGWMFDVIFHLSLGFSSLFVAKIYTFFTSAALTIIYLVFVSGLARFLNLTAKLTTTFSILLSTPFFLYYLSQVEVYNLSAVFALLSVYFLIPEKNINSINLKSVFYSALFYALAVGTHLNILFIAPILFYLFFFHSEAQRRIWLLAEGFLTFFIAIFLIYLPAYLLFNNFYSFWFFAIGGHPSRHFFSAEWQMIFRRMPLIILLYGAPFLILLAKLPHIFRGPNKLFTAVYSGVAGVLTILYITSPINGEIEQLLFVAVLLSAFASCYYYSLGMVMKKIAMVLLAAPFIFLVPLKLAVQKKDSIVDITMRLIHDYIPADETVYNDYLSDYIRLLQDRPIGGTEKLLSTDLDRDKYIIEGAEIMALFKEKGIELEILDKKPITKIFIEKYISYFVSLPHSWSEEMMVARVRSRPQ